MKTFLFVASILIAGANATFQTFANFTDRYSAVFRIEDDPETKTVDAYMKVTLIFNEAPIQIEEKGGMWLGIGFGQGTMLGSDLIICQWNDISGKTRCSDHLASSVYPSKVPDEDVSQNLWTLSGYKADNRLEITFKRYLNTGDST